MRVNTVQSNVIEWLRFFCASAVVLIHARGGGLCGNEVISFHNGIYDSVRIFFSEGICRVAVPVFFLLSGYLFFVNLGEWNNRIWIKKLKKRVRSLLVPYLLWNLISVVLSFGMLYFHYIIKGGDVPDAVDWFDSIGGLRVFVDSIKGLFPYDLPLWFVRDLMIFVLFSPVIFYFLKYTKFVGLSVLYLAYLLGIDDVCLWGNFFQGIFYFSFGAFFSIISYDFFKSFEQSCALTTCVAIPLLFVIVLTYGNNDVLCGYVVRLFTLFGSFLLIGIVTILIKKQYLKVNRLLSNCSFLIYAAHYLLLPIVNKVLYIVLPYNQFGLILRYFTASAFIVSFLVFCFFILSKMMPKTLAVLTGGRI